MPKRWIWWLATTTTKSKVTQETVTISEDGKLAFVTPSREYARTASVVPASRCFPTKAEAEAAMARTGSVGWTYKLELNRWGSDKAPSGGQVKKVRYLQVFNASYVTAYPIDSKNPDDAIHTRHIFKTEKEALRALSEELRDELSRFEADRARAQQVLDFLKAAAAKVEAKGVKIPSAKALTKRRTDRRRRARKTRTV